MTPLDPIPLSLTVTNINSFLKQNNQIQNGNNNEGNTNNKKEKNGQEEEVSGNDSKEDGENDKQWRNVDNLTGDWVMDLDLDFFSSDEPVMRALHRLGFTYSEARSVREAIQSVQLVLQRENLSLIDVETMGKRHKIRSIVNLMANMMEHHLGGTGVYRKKVEKLLYPKKPLSLFGKNVEDGKKALDSLADACDKINLSRKNRKRIKKNLKYRMSEFLDNLLMPEPSYRESKESLLKKTDLIGKIIRDAPNPPKLIVISRYISII